MRAHLAPSLALAVLASLASGQASRIAAEWRLDETTGSVAKDSSSYQNDGSLLNFATTPWVTGRFGNALSFDGVDDYVDVGIKGGLPIYDARAQPYTISFWVKAPAQEDRRCYSEGSSTSSNPLFTIGSGRVTQQNGDRLRMYVRNDQNVVIINQVSDLVVFDDAWHHVVWVDVAGRAALYVDGKKDTADWDYRYGGNGTNTKGFGTFTTDRIALGAVLRSTPCCWLAGLLDELRIYRFAVAETDIPVLMANGPHPPARGSVGTFGFGCGVGPLDIYVAGGELGKTLFLRLVKGPSNAPAFLFFGGALERLDLGLFGFRACELYVPLASLTISGFGALDITGASSPLPLAVPNDAALESVRLTMQGMAVFGSPFAFEFSRAAVVQLGR